MTWQPDLPILTSSDHADWQAWRNARKPEGQRQRRRMYRRIDYCPSNAAHAALDGAPGAFPVGITAP